MTGVGDDDRALFLETVPRSGLPYYAGRTQPAPWKAPQMTPDRRVFLTVSLAAAATGLVGCSGDASNSPDMNQPSGPITLPITDVPSGGGILKGQGYVVTQPSDGQFKAFSAVCPHQGCEVSNIVEDEIVCGCHGSRFALADGSLKKGPATTGLDPATVTRDGDTLTLGPA